MKGRGTRFLLLFWTLIGPAKGQPEGQFLAYIRPLVDTNNFSGVVLISQRDKILFKEAFGYADRAKGTPVQTDTVFQIASLSKVFTASAIMKLVERNLIRTSDPVSKFVKNFTRGDEITIHHLLSHTSGIPDINRMEIYGTLEKRPQEASGLVDRFMDIPLEFDPGEKYAYSNSNYNLLALIIEKVSGQSYGDFLQKELFDPLGLLNTGHPDTTRRRSKERATGYRAAGVAGVEPARALDWTVKTGNGSLYSTVDDLHVWLNAFFSGQVVEPETRALMLKEHVEKVGYGWFIRPRLERTQYDINGRSPGYTAVISHYPEEGLDIVILSNIYVPVPTQMAIDIAAIVFGESVLPIIEGDGKVDPSLAGDLVGKYQFGPDFYQPDQVLEVRFEAGYLSSDWGVLLHRSGRKFILRDYWGQVEFRQEDGRTLMEYDGFTGRPL